MAELLFVWLATYALHGTALLGGVWLLERARLLRDRDLLEWAWRLALFAGIATATVSTVGLRMPSISGATSARATATAPAAPAPRVANPPRFAAADRSEVGAQEPAAPAKTPILLPAATPTRMIAMTWLALALAGALLTLARLASIVIRARRLARCDDRAVARRVDELAAAAGIVAPRLALSESDGSPVVVPIAKLCVPRWTLDELTAAERDAMLAHEVAHVLRRDPLWRIASELVCATLFFQPLNRLAARRLDALAELGCDAWAARHGDPRALATCLVACAERVYDDAPALVAAMARKRSPLLTRIQSLLEDTPMQNPLRKTLTRVALAAAISGVLLLPGVAIHRAIAAEHHSSIEINAGWFGKMMSVDIDADDGSRLKAKVKGEIRFNDAENAVVSVSDNAFIEQTTSGGTHRIELAAAAHGGVDRRYFVDGKERPVDEDARRWLATAIPLLMRETGFDAQAREQRIYARGGADAVLDEVAKIHDDYPRRIYVKALAGEGKLGDAQLSRALQLVAAMRGDYERRESLDALIEAQPLSSANQVALLEAVAQIGSDYEQRTVLATLAPKLASDPAVTAAWSKAIGSVKSDYEARTAIAALAERDDLSREQVGAALAASAAIGSDYEQRTALVELAPHLKGMPELVVSYAKAAHAIQSDFERRTALVELIDSVKLDVDGATAVLDAIADMDGDYERRVVLIELADRMPADAGLVKRYRQIARTLGDYERGQAEKALDRFVEL